MLCFRVAGASLQEMDRSFRQMEAGVNFVENHDATKKITLYQRVNQSQAQKSIEQQALGSKQQNTRDQSRKHERRDVS
jgi:hypothetical protein